MTHRHRRADAPGSNTTTSTSTITALTILNAIKALNRPTLTILTAAVAAAHVLFGVALLVTAAQNAMTVTINLGCPGPSH